MFFNKKINEKFNFLSDNDHQSSRNDDFSSLNELKRKRQRMFFNEKIFFNEMINEKFNFQNNNDHQLSRNNDLSLLNDVISLFSFLAHRIKSFKYFYFKIFVEKKREQNKDEDEFTKTNNIIF